MSNTTEVDLNEGVQIILARMKTNPEEFFDEGGRWRWIFKETLREVLTEIEKAALFEGLKHVRRMEITAKAAATVLRDEEQEKQEEFEGLKQVRRMEITAKAAATVLRDEEQEKQEEFERAYQAGLGKSARIGSVISGGTLTAATGPIYNQASLKVEGGRIK